MENNRTLDTPLAYFELKDNILYATYKQGIIIGINEAKEIVRNRLTFSNDINYPVLVIDMGLKSVNKEARDYLSVDGAKGIIAGALVMKSIYSTFIGNFFLKLTNPPFPSKLFTDVNAAREWLEQYKPKEQPGKQASITV